MKCPSCDNQIGSVKIVSVDVYTNSPKTLKGVAYTCPQCACAISVAVDPVALNAGLLANIKSLLGHK